MTLPVTFEGHFGYCKRLQCLCDKSTAYIMYKVNYNDWMWAINSTVVFNQDFYVTLSTTC